MFSTAALGYRKCFLTYNPRRDSVYLPKCPRLFYKEVLSQISCFCALTHFQYIFLHPLQGFLSSKLSSANNSSLHICLRSATTRFPFFFPTKSGPLCSSCCFFKNNKSHLAVIWSLWVFLLLLIYKYPESESRLGVCVFLSPCCFLSLPEGKKDRREPSSQNVHTRTRG